MCGIVGIFDLSGTAPIDGALLKRMSDAVSHRGPDGEGFYLGAGCGFGHRRLAIIDIAHGQQPMFNEDGSVAVVFNGEIYNFQELASELALAGHIFRSRSDTEVVVHAWEEWGPDCVNRFRGMFAFAVHDRNRDALFLARDRFGKKPLYYALVADRYCLFASELKALLVHPLVEKRLDLSAIDDYFALGYVPDPATMYRGIRKLPPAHRFQLVRGKQVATPEEYWRLSFNALSIGEDEAAHQLVAGFNEAVRVRLLSEVPLGAFLSGGVDSSGIVASMARQTEAPVKTFAIGFGKSGTDELVHASRVARLYRTHHHEQQLGASPLSSYRAQAAIFDEPFADHSSVPTYQLCKLARQNVTVALSGDGGDEMFAGYRRYRWFNRAERLRRAMPRSLRAPLFSRLGILYPKLDWAPRFLRAKYTLQELALDSAMGYYRTVCRVQDALRARLYAPSVRQQLASHHPADRIAAVMQQSDTGDCIARAQYADIKTYLPGDILTKVDRVSMAVSLEVRVPLLDHPFAEWTAKLPTALKLRGGQGKYLLKRALKPYVPRRNLYRPKQGFASSLAPHFRNAEGGFVRETLLGDAMADCGLFDKTTIAQLVEQHVSGIYDHSQVLWSLLMFEGFLREVHFAAEPRTVALAGGAT